MFETSRDRCAMKLLRHIVPAYLHKITERCNVDVTLNLKMDRWLPLDNKKEFGNFSFDSFTASISSYNIPPSDGVSHMGTKTGIIFLKIIIFPSEVYNFSIFASEETFQVSFNFFELWFPIKNLKKSNKLLRILKTEFPARILKLFPDRKSCKNPKKFSSPVYLFLVFWYYFLIQRPQKWFVGDCALRLLSNF